MSNRNNVDALFADAELSFGHPGRNFIDISADFDRFDDRYEPPPVDLSEESIVHYGPGDWPLCGEESLLVAYTDDPHQVVGCAECLELVAEDLADGNEYRGRCLHCRKEISTQGGVLLFPKGARDTTTGTRRIEAQGSGKNSAEAGTVTMARQVATRERTPRPCAYQSRKLPPGSECQPPPSNGESGVANCR